MSTFGYRRPLKLDMDVQTMRAMREQGMSNAEIANSLGCSYQTVLNWIGPMPKKEKEPKEENPKRKYVRKEKNTEKTEEKNSEVDDTVVEAVTADTSLVLKFESRKVTASGKECMYTIDIAEKTLTIHDGLVQGTVNREQLSTLIFELKECMYKLSLCR